LDHFDKTEAEAASYNDSDNNNHEDCNDTQEPQHDEPQVITNVPVSTAVAMPQSPQSQVPPSAPGLQTLLESQQNEDRQR
jgi:hypothetical protein